MTKFYYVLILIILSGCSVLNNEFDQLKLSNYRVVKIHNNIDELSHPTNIIHLNNIEMLFELDSIRNEVFTWSTKDGVSLKLIDGKVIKTTNLEHDFNIINYRGYKEDLSNYSTFIRFRNPDSGFLEIFFSYEIVKEGTKKRRGNDVNYKYRLVKEDFKVPLISWSGVNYYWIDENNSVLVSKQILDPFGKKIRIESLKEYSD